MTWLLAVGLTLGMASWAMAGAEVDELVGRAEHERVQVMKKACSTAIVIFADGGRDGGSGVVISPDGYALSNFHVVSAAGTAMKCGMADGRLYDAVLVGLDPVGDVALVKLLGRNDFPCADLADSDLVRTGDWVFAVGNPFLLATDFQPTVTYGIVSGVHRYQYPSGTLLEYADCLQTDASINPGNSGGPLFNAEGQLIGINGRGSFEKRGRVNVGVGYAISINQIKNFLGSLKSGRIVDHATLGARVANDDEGRVIVSDILDDSDAYHRGLRYGDEIVTFGNRPIHTANGFKNVLGIYPKGWQVPLSYRRQGKLNDILVRLAGVHSEQELIDKVSGRKPEEVPQPKPVDKNPDQPGDKPADEPEKRPPPRAVHAKKATPMPQIVKEHYEARRGYANYYFNKLNRARVWKKFTAHGDYAAFTGAWVLRGQLLTAGDSQFRIGDGQVACSLPGGKLKLDVGDDLSSAADPPGSGGLLAALYLWRRLLVLGPEQFGEVHYQGTAPVEGRAGLCDVLVGTYAAVQSRFFFDPASGDLVKMELYLHAGEDPCELTFGKVEPIDGHRLPRSLEVRLQIENMQRSRGPSFKQTRLRGVKSVRFIRQHLDAFVLLALFGGQFAAASPLKAAADSYAAVIENVEPKIVKIYGAGGFRGLEPYQSGMLISAEGHILTVWSYVLDTDYITATLNDGRKFDAKLLAADPRLELAVLKVEAADLPHFDLAQSPMAPAGTRVLAFSNLFGVATGDEPASVQHGWIAAKTRLEARRGAYETPYKGPVYVLDAMTNNPGAAGGVLTDRQGRLLGMLGKELRNSMTNTWLNYAIPAPEMARTVDEIRAGRFVARASQDSQAKPKQALNLDLLGIVMVPEVLERTPPYVDEVRSDSPAAEAGLRPDDMIVFVNDRLVASCKALRTEFEYIDRIDPVKLGVTRGQELIEIKLSAPKD